jgi:hypothetical protein
MSRLVALILCGLVVASAASVIGNINGDETDGITIDTPLAPHAPIRINGNGDFDPAHGVTGGSGTAIAPWIIDNYDINGTGYGYCIYIGNTTDYFVVKKSYLHEAIGGQNWPSSSESGLILHNV